MIWQPQPAEASSWIQKHFSLEQALLQQAQDGHHSIFCEQLCSRQASSHTCRLHGHPSAAYLFLSNAWKLGDHWRGCKEDGGKGCRARMGFATSISTPHLPLCNSPHTLPTGVRGHFINTIMNLLGSISGGR